jgi:hypothetical protein
MRFSAPQGVAEGNWPSIAHGNSDPSRCPITKPPRTVHCGAPGRLLGLPVKADGEHPSRSHHITRATHRATWLHPAVGSRLSLRLPLPRVGTTADGLAHATGRDSFRVFHIVSTGEPALAVQVGRLRRSPRHRPAGERGLRFPRKQGTGLHQVIHSLSRPPNGYVPVRPPAIHTLSTPTRVLADPTRRVPAQRRQPPRSPRRRAASQTSPAFPQARGRGVDAE